jgi:hypothetical protein
MLRLPYVVLSLQIHFLQQLQRSFACIPCMTGARDDLSIYPETLALSGGV